MSDSRTCPICEEGALQVRTYARVMQHKGVTLSVEGLQSDYCPSCGTETFTPEQLDANARITRDAFIAERERTKNEQNLLTGAEIRHARERLGITQKQAAKVFGGGPTAFAKYEAEDVVQSAAMDKLIRVVISVPEAREWMFNYAGISGTPRDVQLALADSGFRKSHSLTAQTTLSNVFVEDGGVKSGKFLDWDALYNSSGNEEAFADAA